MIPSRQFSVVMERRALASRWVDHQWHVVALADAITDNTAQCMHQDESLAQWVYPPLTLSLHTDEVDNYLLNLSATEPCVFVVLRDDEAGLPVPTYITVSYGEAARHLDAGERVEPLPLPHDVWSWVLDFSRAHFRPPEPRREKRYARSGTTAPERMAG